MRATSTSLTRRGLGLGAAAFAVHPLQRQLDRLGSAGVGHPGGVLTDEKIWQATTYVMTLSEPSN
jgi:hypothetical protein